MTRRGRRPRVITRVSMATFENIVDALVAEILERWRSDRNRRPD